MTYYWDGTDKPYYSGNSVSGNLTSSHNVFYWYDKNTKSFKSSNINLNATEENKKLITNVVGNYYAYNPMTLTANNSDAIAEGAITSDSKEYNMLFTGKDGNTEKFLYWTSSTLVSCRYDYLFNGLRCVEERKGKWRMF